MAWFLLIVSAVLEAVWATALGQVQGLDQPLPIVIFVVALTASMFGLGIAAKQIPIGTAYAVWTGSGAALTIGWAMVTGAEPASALKLLFIAGIIGAVTGLKFLGSGHEAVEQPEPLDETP